MITRGGHMDYARFLIMTLIRMRTVYLLYAVALVFLMLPVCFNPVIFGPGLLIHDAENALSVHKESYEGSVYDSAPLELKDIAQERIRLG